MGFSPCIRGGWISDDKATIIHNRDLLETGGLGRIWRGADSPDYFPLSETAQWAEWRLFHERTAGYHWVNVGMHLLASVLVWRLLRKLGLRPAWLGAMFFALHPLAVESVAWISE